MSFVKNASFKKLAFLSVIIFSLLTSSLITSGKSISDLKEEQEKINEQKEETDNHLQEVNELKENAQTERDILDIELVEATHELELVQNELKETTELLNQTILELEEAARQREKHYSIFRERFAAMYENGNTGYLDVILNSDNFSDLLKRIEYINFIMDYDNNLVNDLIEIERTIEEKALQIEKKKAEVEVLLAQQEEKTLALEAKLEEKRLLIEKLEADANSYQQQIDELEASDKEIQKLIEEAEAEEQRKREEAARQAAAAAASGRSSATYYDDSSFTYTGGQLAWPVPGRGRISSSFGNRRNPISGRSEYHTGIDIPAPTGTDIIAVEDGVVLSAGWQNGYGYTVVISHGSGLSSMYAHNSKLVVSAGQSVVRGQVIAKAGSTGYSTGPHLHFEIRLNGKHVNPVNYIK